MCTGFAGRMRPVHFLIGFFGFWYILGLSGISIYLIRLEYAILNLIRL